MSEREAGEYFIEFNTVTVNGKTAIDAVRVRIDVVRVTDMGARMHINLCEHPLYKELQDYVRGNPR